MELTDAEAKSAIDWALSEARRLKYYRMEHEKRTTERLTYETNMRRDWTPAELLAYLTNLNPRFVIDERNAEVVNLLALYFTGNPDFEQHGYRLDKGLLLLGNVGVGKTDLMRFFRVNKRMSYGLYTCSGIATRFATDGFEVLDTFHNNRDEGAGDSRIFYQRETGYCFDDLGVEDDRKNFGNGLNVMANILLERYENRHRVPFFSTHMTTNLTIKKIGEVYGDRVASRLPEMFNFIVLDGDDRRR